MAESIYVSLYCAMNNVCCVLSKRDNDSPSPRQRAGIAARPAMPDLLQVLIFFGLADMMLGVKLEA